MKELIEYIAKEWDALAKAPVAFILFLIICGGVAYTAARWRYEGIIDTLKERLETEKSRVAAKDTQLDDYRQLEYGDALNLLT